MGEKILLGIIAACGAAVILSLKELLIWFLNRRAHVNDTESDKEDSMNKLSDDVSSIKDDLKVIKDSLDLYKNDYKIVLKDKIKYLVYKYREIGEISLENKLSIKHMWHLYHFDLGGNGDLDEVMDVLETIPLKDPSKEN